MLFDKQFVKIFIHRVTGEFVLFSVNYIESDP